MKDTTLSVIIIAHNNPSIYECINSIKMQIDEKDEIILVDDHSSEDYFRAISQYCSVNNVILLKSIKRGNRSSNRNLGASRAKNEILLFVDADMILFETAIQAIKRAYLSKEHIAYIGTRCSARYDPLRMKILDGINIDSVIKQHETTAFLSEIPSIKDKRITPNIYVEGYPEQKFYWIYYYTCCCTILRDIFIKIGGFEESFVGWGVEDIDLGFRISLNGSISFLRGFTGIHVPHNRNVLYAEQDNCNNLKAMLKKYQRYDIELISVYRGSSSILEKMRMFMNRMRLISLPQLLEKENKDILYVNPVSLNCPNGKLVHYDKDGVKKTYELIGISTFFEPKGISTIIISKDIVLYPISIICGILQECMRIGNYVYLEGDEVNHRLDWNDFPNLTLLQPQKRNEYRIHDFMEINFNEDKNQKRYLITSDYLDLEVSKTVPQKLLHRSEDYPSIVSKTYCVINLSAGTGYRMLLKQLNEIFHLNYVGTYSLDSRFGESEPNDLPQTLTPLLCLNTSILFVVNNIDTFNYKSVEIRKGKNDLFVDLNGKILII